VGVRNSQQRLEGLRRGRISKADAQEFLNSLGDLNIHLTDPLSYGAVFEIAERHSLTVYDAAYLELAIRERLALASLDAALIRAARKEQVAIF
jgi:predicted nucleic acid-binding protein